VLASELVATVVADYALEVRHGEEIWVVPAWSLENHRKSCVQHLVVSLIEQGGGEVWLIAVGHLTDSEGWDGAEVVADF
jgi:hypothetical protein